MPDERFQIGDYWLSRRPGSPYWHRTWFDNHTRQTRRVSLRTADLADAKVALAQYVTSYGQWQQHEASAVMLADVFARYYERHVKTLSRPDSQRQSLYLVLRYRPELTVAEFTLERQEELVAEMRRDGYRSGTVKRALNGAHAALGWAKARELIDRTPARLPVPDDPPRDRVLTVEELAALWDQAHLRHQQMFLLLLIATGARPGAVLDLSRFQCDVTRKLIDLQPPGRPQNKKRRPVVPMVAALRPYIATAPAGPLVQYNGHQVRSMKKSWQAMRSAAGLDRDVVPYTIRHTVATELRARLVPPWEVAAWLGHEMPNLRTTERYAKFAPDYLARGRDAIDALISEIGRVAARPISNVEPRCVSDA
jgi:integrase